MMLGEPHRGPANAGHELHELFCSFQPPLLFPALLADSTLRDPACPAAAAPACTRCAPVVTEPSRLWPLARPAPRCGTGPWLPGFTAALPAAQQRRRSWPELSARPPPPAVRRRRRRSRNGSGQLKGCSLIATVGSASSKWVGVGCRGAVAGLLPLRALPPGDRRQLSCRRSPACALRSCPSTEAASGPTCCTASGEGLAGSSLPALRCTPADLPTLQRCHGCLPA